MSIILPIMVLIENLKKKGFSSKTLSMFENPGTCMARLILNDKVEDLIERVCEDQIKEEQLNYDHLVVSLRPKMDKVKYSNLKLNIVKNVALSYKLLGNFKYQS